MNSSETESAVSRIKHMEACFDGLLSQVRKTPENIDKALLDELCAYYEGGRWLKDYELDEKGLLPADLKRGVLSEDGVYDLILDIEALEKEK